MLVTNDWGPMTPVLNVDYYQPIARVANLSREDVGLALLATTDGLPVGSYYEGEHDLPIYIKSMGKDGLRPGRLNNVPVWSLVPSTNMLSLETVKELMMGMISTDEVMTAVVGYTVDMIMAGNQQSSQVFIVTHDYEKMAQAIVDNVHRGVTLIDSQGWYSKKESKIVMVVCRKRETSMILKFVKTIDPEAFMTVGSVMGVYGKGFQTIGKG